MGTALVNPENLPDDFYNISQIPEDYEISRSTVYNYRLSGKIPKTTRYGNHFVGWPKSEIQPFLDRLKKREVEK